jgi:hypothetical protein
VASKKKTGSWTIFKFFHCNSALWMLLQACSAFEEKFKKRSPVAGVRYEKKSKIRLFSTEKQEKVVTISNYTKEYAHT